MPRNAPSIWISCRGYPLLLMLLAVATAGVSGCGSTPEQVITRPVSPVSPLPTETWLPGKVVWADLVTADLESAVEFYSFVFGWKFVISDTGDYAEASYHGRMVGSIARFARGDGGSEDARWLISISVADVDTAAAEVTRQGGEVLIGPENLPNRGRYALIKDAQGAMCMLLKSTGGDPEDRAATENEWQWAELWTRDLDRAAAFYGSVAGYRSRTVIDRQGDQHLVLGQGGEGRAGIAKLLWEEVEPNWVPYLLVASVADTLAAVEEYGGSVVYVPADNSTVALVADPTGGVFAIQEQEVR